uniref:EF-hand domain-containing protein n=1 Tax=Macrostomum lignano TaxID=282301 RepID=A0A1I8FBR1_9PLAT
MLWRHQYESKKVYKVYSSIVELLAARGLVAEYREAFALFDKDAEMPDSQLQAIGAVANARRNVADKDGRNQRSDKRSGSIDFSEFVALMETRKTEDELRSEIQETFKVPLELRHVLSNLGIKLSEREAADMIAEADFNKDRAGGLRGILRMMTARNAASKQRTALLAYLPPRRPVRDRSPNISRPAMDGQRNRDFLRLKAAAARGGRCCWLHATSVTAEGCPKAETGLSQDGSVDDFSDCANGRGLQLYGGDFKRASFSYAVVNREEVLIGCQAEFGHAGREAAAKWGISGKRVTRYVRPGPL